MSMKKLVVFGSLKWQGPDVSTVHGLEAEEILGLDCMFQDIDGPYDAGIWILTVDKRIFTYSDVFSDFVLMPVNEEVFGSAVRERTWGQMKATRFQNDVTGRR